MKSRAFQLMAKEDCVTPNIVMVMSPFIYELSLSFMLMLHVVMYRDVLSEQIGYSGSFLFMCYLIVYISCTKK